MENKIAIRSGIIKNNEYIRTVSVPPTNPVGIITVVSSLLVFDPWFSLVKKKIGDTEYGIGWLPLGGYVKISGMIDESMDTEQMKKPAESWEFRAKPAWQRLIIMLGGVTVNLLLGIFIYSMILCVWGNKYVFSRKV